MGLSVLLGHAMPGDALAASGLANSFSAINSGATPVGRDDSLDFVFAFGVSR